jgi:hypothetical protein
VIHPAAPAAYLNRVLQRTRPAWAASGIIEGHSRRVRLPSLVVRTLGVHSVTSLEELKAKVLITIGLSTDRFNHVSDGVLKASHLSSRSPPAGLRDRKEGLSQDPLTETRPSATMFFFVSSQSSRSDPRQGKKSSLGV